VSNCVKAAPPLMQRDRQTDVRQLHRPCWQCMPTTRGQRRPSEHFNFNTDSLAGPYAGTDAGRVVIKHYRTV